MMRRILFLLVTISFVILFLVLGACEKSAPRGTDRLRVVTTLFPVYDFARQVGRDKIELSLLLPPGVEPHHFEPGPQDMLMLTKADLIIFANGYMEPWAARLAGTLDTSKTVLIESGKGIKMISDADRKHHDHAEHAAKDPHVWLDPLNAIAMVDNISAALIEKDEANKDFYKNNASVYKAKLKELDASFSKGLSECASRRVISAGHMSFAYLAARYSLASAAAYGLSPDSEPTPESMVNLSRIIKKEGLKYVFVEELVSQRVAETISRETGASILLLHGTHNISRQEFEAGLSFVTLMERNLDNLRKGLQCR